MSETHVFQQHELPKTNEEAQHESHFRHNLLDLVKSAKETPLAPAINALAVEPANIAIGAINAAKHDAAWLVNKAIGTHITAREVASVEPLALTKAKEGSANYYEQKFFEGAGSLMAVAASGSMLGKVAHGASELRALELGAKELHAGTALRSLAHDSLLLKKASVIGTGLKEVASTPLVEILEHAKSVDSPVARSFSINQKALLDAYQDTHKLANLDGIAVEGKKVFDHPTTLSDPHMRGAEVTSVTTYANGVKVYENPLGITKPENPKFFDNATRLTTDHQTFMKKEWGGKVTLLDGVGGGATVDSVTEMRSGAAAYINEDGLYHPHSERVLLQGRDARLRLFDQSDEVKALTSDGHTEANVQKIADTFSGARTNERVERLLAQVSPEDRPIADAIMKASAPSIHGLDLMGHLRATAQDGQEWWQTIKQPRDVILTSVHPAADDSAQAFSYLAGKSGTSMNAGAEVLNLPQGAKPRESLLLFGDASKYSDAEISRLKELRASGTQMAIFDNSFGRSVNAVDLVKGTASEKLGSLIDEVKAAGGSANPEETVSAILHAPGRKLADELGAKLLGENLPTTTVSREDLVRRMNEDLAEKYPLADDRAAASRAIADIRFHDLPDVIEELQHLHHFIEGVTHQNALYVSQSGKSQALIGHLYQEANGLGENQFISKASLDGAPQDQLQGKSLVLLDDAAYSGTQVSNAVDDVHHKTKGRNPVVVGNLTTYQKAHERLAHKDNLQLVTLEITKPIHDPGDHVLDGFGNNGVRGADVVDSAQSPLDAAAVEAKRLNSFYEFNRGGTFGQMGNRTIFFYKQADSTPTFVEDFLNKHFGITQ